MKMEAVDHGLELNRRERMNRGNGTISELADASHQVSSAFAATGYRQGSAFRTNECGLTTADPDLRRRRPRQLLGPRPAVCGEAAQGGSSPAMKQVDQRRSPCVQPPIRGLC